MCEIHSKKEKHTEKRELKVKHPVVGRIFIRVRNEKLCEHMTEHVSILAMVVEAFHGIVELPRMKNMMLSLNHVPLTNVKLSWICEPPEIISCLMVCSD